MMTQQLRFSVLTAPLAAIDRRTLSQAWYSALHLGASRAEPKRAHPASTRAAQRLPQAANEGVAALRTGTVRIDLPKAFRRDRTAVRGDAGSDRRTARSALSRKIEHRFFAAPRRPQRATFTIDGTQARVHVALLARGPRMTMVAVCSPPARPFVAKALQEARFALAERGIDLAVETRASQCS